MSAPAPLREGETGAGRWSKRVAVSNARREEQPAGPKRRSSPAVSVEKVVLPTKRSEVVVGGWQASRA